jgi:hypothetical protein
MKAKEAFKITSLFAKAVDDHVNELAEDVVSL